VPELPPPPDASGGAGPSLAAAIAWLQSARHSPWWAAAAGALAVGVLGAVAWAAFRPGANPPPIELELPRADAPAASSSEAASERQGAAVAADRPAGAVVVHVAGAVASPGLYRLGGDARVADALDAAGGPAPDAELDAVNLAAKVADGERVYVPRKGEAPPLAVAGGAGGAGGGAPAGPLDLNTATAEQLEALPGVGPATAEAILAYRQEKGRFRSVDELLEVRGIGEAKLGALRSKVTVR
jgi:competence protein ComEA